MFRGQLRQRIFVDESQDGEKKLVYSGDLWYTCPEELKRVLGGYKVRDGSILNIDDREIPYLVATAVALEPIITTLRPLPPAHRVAGRAEKMFVR